MSAVWSIVPLASPTLRMADRFYCLKRLIRRSMKALTLSFMTWVSTGCAACDVKSIYAKPFRLLRLGVGSLRYAPSDCGMPLFLRRITISLVEMMN